MIKVGHELSDQEIEQRYSALAGALQLPAYFYPAVAAFARPAGALRVLDVGCGNGELLAEVRRVEPETQLVGTEIAAGRLRLVRSHLGNAPLLIQVDGKGWVPLRDQSVDLVLVTEVIEHLKQPVTLLRDLRRVLAPGGHLVLTTPNSDAYPFWPFIARIFEHTKRQFFKHFLPFEHPLKTRQPIDTVLAIDEVRAMLRAAGLRPTRVAGREALPFLFALPGMRGLAHRGYISRSLVDTCFTKGGMVRYCYRILWDCIHEPSAAH